MYDRDGKVRIKASGEPFPADDQAAISALNPAKHPLGLVARNLLFDCPAPSLAAFPDALGNLGANPTPAEATAEVFGVIPLIQRQHLGAFPGSASCAGADVEAIQPRQDLRPLVPLGRGRARG
jgi:hypothetical protein